MNRCKWICIIALFILPVVAAGGADDTFKSDLTDAILDRFQLDPESIEIEFRKIRFGETIPVYDSLAVEPMTQAEPIGRIIVKADLFKNNKVIESGQISINIKRFMDVLVASERIGRNKFLSSESIVIENRSVTALVDKPLTTLDETNGRWSKRRISKGDILTHANTELIPTVQAGQEISIVYRTSGLEISAQGTALENGYSGETIRVRNDKSKKTINATISDDYTAIINP